MGSLTYTLNKLTIGPKQLFLLCRPDQSAPTLDQCGAGDLQARPVLLRQAALSKGRVGVRRATIFTICLTVCSRLHCQARPVRPHPRPPPRR